LFQEVGLSFDFSEISRSKSGYGRNPMNFLHRTLPAGLIVLLTACGGNTAPAQPNVETIVAATLGAATQQAAQNPATQVLGTPVTFENVSIVIPDGLGDHANGEIVPLADESTDSDPWGMAPEHILITLTNYPAPPDAFDPVIRIYPAQAYADVNSWANGSIAKLRAILASPGMAITNDNAPEVPFFGAAAQQYAAQIQLLSFNGGDGVRMISQYGQFPGPITKNHGFYHYEGLTGDGKYLVAALLPLSLPLQSTSENPSADGVEYPGDISDTNGLTAYYQGITDLLNAADPDSFQPSLTQLDALIQSIQIK
jgi:hypothetical protein